jgi:hypothetical protein
MKVILFTSPIPDPDVMIFRNHPLVGIDISHVAIKFQTLKRSQAVKWLMAIEPAIVVLNESYVYLFIQIVSKCESTNIVSPVLFTLHAM